MIKEILTAIEEMASSSNTVCTISGEIDRLSELSGVLSEKVKTYREVGDYEGANAISVILIDDVRSELDDLFEKFHKAMEIFEQKAKRLKNVCAFYGINIQLGKDDKIIHFNR
ncbi:hypothetical protein JZG80_07250 [Staphylococcus saprophyticus]|uniref:hypothetical protein n=1 Tax=Staphylococcus saprophyticus TaxID=29385 RepID=UPI001013CC37|nr:hypothetical protein [Staphylococcus saprophyticus]MBN6092369.1 hypothetical protein [Staphylococcus saprophyticus]MDW4312497.1 hypothetical protein [Staphylococcus saprophyticus]MDW4371586.1 hypothetical protein [Staphylococcus saprophyticus]RXS01978.1 hypothetical protein EUA49_10545 [Staphylococcus saprophyticus]